ncbi:DNA-binding transcriptional regulator, XRE-family HTH domain [Streptomyces sp. 1222.2]|uniref:helix-turn-helix transcriptional regulator n=1 Tax=Streptomyces sp. 1222.2 TaxID=1938833 RepID=UPI000BD2C72D|nr:helix-turn-helix transcriptional regulator [Streptomyces sp. 1222.2]SOD77043.1 DNA-binding transcriptional regulator, XRE-family HTH domain [Streptomyces sp. 1222.2]
MRSDAEHIDGFAAWIEGVMRARGYDLDSPRGGGRTKLAEDAGVHRAAITRLLQRRSMPDLETMRGLSRALGIPVRDVLIRSGKLTEQDLPQAPEPPGTGTAPGGPTLSAEQAATALGIPEHLRAAFVRITEQFRRGTAAAPAAPEPATDGRTDT